MKLENTELIFLKEKARELKKTMFGMLYSAGSGHPGGSLSAADIITYLYYKEMNVNPRHPNNPNRDRFILSKGHACPILYAVLADIGFFPAEELKTFRQFHSILQGHPDRKKVPGIEISSGSLGMGISFGIGTALGAQLENRDYRTYVITGDGELDEGQNWEAFMCASKYKLDNLTVVVDHNKVQLDGTSDEVMPLGDIAAKIRAFGWNVVECNGHDFNSIAEAFDLAHSCIGRPTAIVAHTIKGKGVSFMEGKSEWHGKTVDKEAYEKVIEELER